MYQMLKQAIMTGELQPRKQLVEQALAEWCEVSRTPVREALNRLEHDGLVVRGERGLVVRESSPEEILDIYETRIVLEATAARVAAERRTSHDLLRMRQLHKRMVQSDAGDLETRTSLNDQFHRAVWRSSHNRSLVDLLERLDLHLGWRPAATLSYPGRWEAILTEHEGLIEALDARDSAAAERVATDHFNAARDIRLSIWEDEE